jgi:hypothetical protein
VWRTLIIPIRPLFVQPGAPPISRSIDCGRRLGQLVRQAEDRMEIRYLNTDLEIESENDISRIVEEFGDDVMLLHQGEIRGYMHGLDHRFGHDGTEDRPQSRGGAENGRKTGSSPHPAL